MKIFVCLVLSAFAPLAGAATIQFQGDIRHYSYSQKSGRLAVLSVTGKEPSSERGFVHIIDVKEGKTITQFPLGWASPYNTKIALSPDGKQVVVAINGIPQAKIWSVETGKAVSEIRLGDFFIDIDPVISPDGKTLALATYFSSMLVVDMETGQLLYRIPSSQTATLKPSFSPSGKDLAVIDRYDESVKIYDARTGQLKKRVEDVLFGSHQTFGNYLSIEDEYVVAAKDGLKRLNVKTGEMSETFAPNSYFLRSFVGDFAREIFILSSLEGQETVTQWDGITGEEGPKSIFEKEKKCSALFAFDDHVAIGCFPAGRADDTVEIQIVK